MAAHTHEAPDDIVYVHAAWTDHRLIEHLRQEHGAELPSSPLYRQALILMHAEAHTQVLSDGDRLLIVDQERRDYAAALLRRMATRTAEVEHAVLENAFGDREVTLTSLDNIEKWLVDTAQRLEKGVEL